MWKTRDRLGCNARRLDTDAARNFILSDSGPKLFIAPDKLNLVVIFLAAPAVAHRRRFLVRAVLGIGLPFVLGGQFQETFPGKGIAGRPREAAASFRLLPEID